MSSFRKVAKARQKKHRERSQPEARKHLGFLQKKKDYKQRADDYNRKQRALKRLRQKALDKNPDEFYFKMVKTKMEGGVHQTEDTTPEYTEDQLKLIQTQDIKYVNYKRSTELKKIEKLKSGLHLIDATDKPQNQHKVFVDSKREAANFDAAEYFNTHPALVNRAFNRPKLETLKKRTMVGQLDDKTLVNLAKARESQYKELSKRIEREKQLLITAQKMEMKKHLMDKKGKKEKVADGTSHAAPVYKWVPQRKR